MKARALQVLREHPLQLCYLSPHVFSVAETQPTKILVATAAGDNSLVVYTWPQSLNAVEVLMQVSPASNQSVWKRGHQDALFEVDQTRLRPKLETALKLVEDRLSELHSDPTDCRELMELEDAKRISAFLWEHELQT